MAFKFIVFFAVVTAASAYPQHYYEQQELVNSYQPAALQQVVQPAAKKIVEHEEPANYDFEYSVHDDHTGDIKQQHESAKNGAIEGFYTLVDSDGYKRIVHYTADHEHGFNAEVRREPIEGHQIVKNVQPAIVKKVVAQPAVAVEKYVAAPQYYSAPAPAPKYYSAPAPVVENYDVAPVVQKYVAAPVEHYASKDANTYTHVSFKGPSSSYNY